MSGRSHRSLRLGALALLAALAIWPRARAGTAAAELGRGARDQAHHPAPAPAGHAAQTAIKQPSR